MKDLQSSIEKLRAKQLALRKLKLHHFTKEESQQELNQYTNSLSKEDVCKYMTGISGIINLCNNHFECKFKGEVYKSFTKNPRKECLRARAVKFEKILEH